MVYELEGDAGIRDDGPEDRHELERAQDGRRHLVRELDVGDALHECQRVGPGDDAGAKDVGADLGAGHQLAERQLQLGLLGRVVVTLGTARLEVLGEHGRVVGGEAVGGHRRGVDQASHPRVDGGVEHVARAGQVDLGGVLGAAHDHEGEMDDNVGPGDHLAHGGGVEHVGAAVLHLVQALGGGIKRPARHGGDPSHPGVALQDPEQRAADVPGRAGDRDGERRGRVLAAPRRWCVLAVVRLSRHSRPRRAARCGPSRRCR